ncbi:MAG: Fic family protein [Trueperaceae bacterium]
MTKAGPIELPITRAGAYLNDTSSGEPVNAHIPPRLPLQPPLQLGVEHYDLIERANRALGRLDGIGTLLPDPHLFIYMYLRKEALLSSQIEGTQSSLSDLLLFEHEEAPGAPLNEVREVSNYVDALNFGLRRVKEENFPISSRLIREVHGVLMKKGRGSEKSPGEFRTSQNWLGGTRPGNALYVPPPHAYVPELIANLEGFIHDQEGRTPTLIKAAVSHVQFESIHPFLDGNGRLGRLLITLILCAEEVLLQPTLYLSLYFKSHRETYYELLQKVRTQGAWEQWLLFFLDGVFETAQQAFRTAQALVAMFARDRSRIETIGRAAGSALQVHRYLQEHVFLSISDAAADLNLSPPTIGGAIENLEALSIVREITGKERNRLWVYGEYLAVLSEGTEPLR